MKKLLPYSGFFTRIEKEMKLSLPIGDFVLHNSASTSVPIKTYRIMEFDSEKKMSITYWISKIDNPLYQNYNTEEKVLPFGKGHTAEKSLEDLAEKLGYDGVEWKR